MNRGIMFEYLTLLTSMNLDGSISCFCIPDLLKKQGKACLLTWLQQILLDACMVKINNGKMFTEDGEVLEPVPHHFNCKGKFHFGKSGVVWEKIIPSKRLVHCSSTKKFLHKSMFCCSFETELKKNP